MVSTGVSKAEVARHFKVTRMADDAVYRALS